MVKAITGTGSDNPGFRHNCRSSKKGGAPLGDRGLKAER
jgi:hypothetical protein